MKIIERLGALMQRNDEDFVSGLYQELLNRNPDDAGLRLHSTLLQQGVTRMALIEAILRSPEAMQQLNRHSVSYHRIPRVILTLREMMALDIERFVDTLYEQVLRRVPDAAGRNLHIHALEAGASRFEIVLSVLRSPEAQSLLSSLQESSASSHSNSSMRTAYKDAYTRPPKIAYVIPDCGLSGGVAVICQHANRLFAKGHDVTLISQSGQTSIDWFPNQQVKIIPLAEVTGDFDILVATGWATAYTVDALSAARKIYFVQSDESRFFPSKSTEQRAALATYQFNFEYMTEAKWIARWLEKDYGHKALYVPNGIDEALIYRTHPIEPRTGRVRVLLEGPIDIPYKGMADAFEAVKDLDCEVWCVSSVGVPKPGWRCDRFFSTQPFGKMREIYSSCDILLKMSRVEGFFGPPMEMMACGGTCVVSEVTGYDEYIVHGTNALVVPMGDIAAAKSAVQQLILDRGLREQLAENGRRTAGAWRWEPTIQKLEEFFGLVSS